MNWRAAVVAGTVVFAVSTHAAHSVADGNRSRVALVRTPDSDKLLREAATRLKAELHEAGFDVVEVESAPGDPRAEVEGASARSQSFATIAINRAGSGALADAWISDHVTGKTVVRRLRVGGDSSAATVLAIRVLELLRASLLEVAAPPRGSGPPPSAPPDVLGWVEPTLPTAKAPAERDALEGPALAVGVLGLHSLRGIGLALGPTVRISHGIDRHFFGRLVLTGPLVGPSVDAPGGSASVRLQFISLEMGWATATRPLGAFAWIGGGAFLLQTTGAAVPPYRSTSDSVWSFLATAGIGGIAHLGPRIAVTSEISILGLVPQPVVVIASQRAGTAGAPSLAASIGMLVSF
jgi:hypothetical protein